MRSGFRLLFLECCDRFGVEMSDLSNCSGGRNFRGVSLARGWLAGRLISDFDMSYGQVAILMGYSGRNGVMYAVRLWERYEAEKGVSV